jgi:hypothetical protein
MLRLRACYSRKAARFISGVARMKMSKCVLGACLAAIFSSCAAHAAPEPLDPLCSDPRRAGPLAAMELRLRKGGYLRLERQLSDFAERHAGMSVSSSMMTDPEKPQPYWTRNVTLQSPQFSVAISASTASWSRTARLVVARTCVSDATEDWHPYWARLRTYLRRRGYVIFRFCPDSPLWDL